MLRAYEVLGVRGAPQRPRHSVSPRTTGREHVQGVRLLHHLRGFAFSLVPVTQQVRVQQQCLSDEAHMSQAYAKRHGGATYKLLVAALVGQQHRRCRQLVQRCTVQALRGHGLQPPAR